MDNQLYRVEVYYEGIEQPDVTYTYDGFGCQPAPEAGKIKSITYTPVSLYPCSKKLGFWWRLWQFLSGRVP
jgi:hypothetical protein